MKRLTFLRLFLVFSLALEGLSGCASQPELLSQARDLSDTHVFHKENSVVDKEELWGRPLKLPEVDRYVNSIRERLETHTQSSVGHIDVLDGSLVNGRLDWGMVDLTRGMLNACRNEAELAAYIGHELGHYQQFQEGLEPKKSFLTQMVDKGLQYVPDQTGAIQTAQQEKEDIRTAQFSQAKEQDADERGAELAAKSGYNPYALADLFDRLSAMVTTNPVLYRIAKLKGSHKALDVRARHLRTYLAAKGYKHTGQFGARRYATSLASLAAYEKVSEKNTVPPELAAELAGFQSEIQQHQKNHQPLPAPRFMQIMSRLAELNRTYSALSDPHVVKPRRHRVAFMEEALYMDTPSWTSIGSGVATAIEGLLSGLGHLAVAGMPMIGDPIDLYELASGKDFFTGQAFAPPGAGLAVVGLLATGAGVVELAGFLAEAGPEIDAAAATKALEEGAELEKGIDASPTLNKIEQNSNFSPADFYVRPDGDVIPATGYRYLAEDASGIDNVLQTGEVAPRSDPSRPNYISFDDFSNSSDAESGLQLPYAPRYKVEFNTLQVSDSLQIPNGDWGKADYLEPIAKDFPNFGDGGATQAVTQQGFQATAITDLQTGEVVFDGS